MNCKNKKRRGMIANETTFHKRTNDKEINIISHRMAFNHEKTHKWKTYSCYKYCLTIDLLKL